MVGRQRSHAHDHMSVLIGHIIDIPAPLAYVQKHQAFEFADALILHLDLRPLLFCRGYQGRRHDLDIRLAFLLSGNVATNQNFAFGIRLTLRNALLQSRLYVRA